VRGCGGDTWFLGVSVRVKGRVNVQDVSCIIVDCCRQGLLVK